MYDPFHPLGWTPTSREVIEHGRYLRPDSEPMSDGEVRRVRATILGRYSRLRRSVAPTVDQAVRSLIAELWRWGSIPMLGGNPKAGKSTLVAELIAALIIPGSRFLGIFPPIEMTDEERARAIWLINAENGREELHEALMEVGLECAVGDNGELYYCAEGGGVLYVEHLEYLGGPSKFDLTDPDTYDEWAGRFMWCPCDGTNEQEPPLVVIVDGVTAILGSKTERYGEWYASFRSLMRELDVANALGVAHNGLTTGHLMNGVESMAGPDGLWSYSSNNPDDPNSWRYVSVVPRLRGPKLARTRVVMVDGRLVIQPSKTTEPSNEPGQKLGEDAQWEADVIQRLQEVHPAGRMKNEVTGGGGNYGDKRRSALKRLAESDPPRVRSVPEGLGTRWFLTDS